MKSRIITTLLSLFFMGSASAQLTAYVPGVSNEGVVYFLPKTAITVSITTEKTTYVPGELCQYAERYLRTSNISSKEETRCVIKSATLSTKGLPDERKSFHILFSPKSVAPLVTLTEDGILMAVNAEVAEEKFVEVMQSSASCPVPPPAVHSYMTEEMLMAGSKAKLAELVAKEIYAIRESRNLIIRGQNEYMPKDAESLQIILAGLEEQEQAFTQLFTGVTSTEVTTQTYQVIPETNVERIVLGRFSRKLGLLHGDDLAGSPIYIDIKGKQLVSVPAEKPVVETVKTKKLKRAKDENSQDGLVYNVPGKATVKVYTNTQVLVEEQVSLAQFGNTETFSKAFFTEKKNIKVSLDPVTGALLKVEK